MKKNTFILISLLLLLKLTTKSQCPERDQLSKRILTIHTSQKLSIQEQLIELHKYLDSLQRCPGKNDSTHAYLLRMIGSKYGKTGDYLKAVEYFRKSISLITSNIANPSINPQHLVRSYFWLFSYYDSLNNVSEKMKAVDECIASALKYNSSSDNECIRALYERVEYFFDIGDYHKCIEDAIMCEKLALDYTKNGNETAREHGKRIASSSLGWHIKALIEIKHFEQAEKLLANKPNEYNKLGLKNYLGLIHEQLAQVQINKGNYDKALIYLNQALKYEEDAGYDFNIKQVLKTIGYNIYFKHYHDNKKALTYLKNALTYHNKNKYLNKEDTFESLNILADIGNVYSNQNMFDSAFKNYQYSFNQIETGINEKDILLGPIEEIKGYKKIYYLISLVIDKADAFRKKYELDKHPGDVQEAVRIYKAADQLLNRIKTEQLDLQSKLFWRNDSRRLYEHAIDACYLQGNMKDAFYFFEKSRAVLLNDQLAAQQYLGTNDILKQVQVKKKITTLEKELADTPVSSKNHIEVLQKKFELTQELERLEQSIKEKNPLYYQSALDTTFIELSDVQNRLLKDHQALLEIFSGDSSVYSLLITSKQVYLNKISKPDFETTTNSYIAYISNAELLNKDFKGYTKTAHHLFKLIFDKSPLPNGRIIISPDGRYFPFEALVTDGGPSPVYFLNDHIVSYTYSARYLQNNFVSNTSAVPQGFFLGIAPVQYTPNTGLVDLDGSENSLSKISSFIGRSHNLIGAQASRDNFMKQFSNYKIIQLYTHASDSSNQNEPVIYFADSALYLSELMPDKIPSTQLIVLSACETGIGRIYQGEGIFSFNRGFAAFGVPSSISNLWAVENLASYRLTELFYKYLSTGIPVDIALQKAKLEYMATASKEKTLPYYWAAAVLVGKTDAIKYNNPISWKIPLLITVIAGLLTLSGWIFYSRRKKVVIHKNKLYPV